MKKYEKLFNEIGLSAEGREIFYRLNKALPENTAAEANVAFDEGNAAFEKYVLSVAETKGEDPAHINLYVTLLLCERGMENYKRLDAEDPVIYEAMRDIASKCESTKIKEGVYGIPVFDIPWFRYIISGILFKLGRFQYQIAESEYDLEVDGVKISKGDRCFFVHVPGSEPLNTEICDASYKEALAYFGRRFGIDKLVCFCYSWLLQPWLSDVLSEDTNIMKFKNSYELVETVESIWHTFNFIFPNEEKDLDDYPADNSLRRMAIERRRRGDFIGYGVGVRIIK